ncbi:MAG: hypothetical protein ACLTS6_11045 [Anaerobutyricum sp.]
MEEYSYVILVVTKLSSFCFYTGAKDATIVRVRLQIMHIPEHPGLDDFGDAVLVGG